MISSIPFYTYITIRTNEKEIPFIKDLFIDIQNRYDASFYGYLNSDILFDDTIISTLQSVHIAIQNKQIKKKVFYSFQLYAQVLLTGQRTNVDFINNRPIPSSSLYHSYIQYLARIGNLFTGLALVSSLCLALMNRIILSFPKVVFLLKGSLISLLVGLDMIITLVTLSITTVKTMIGLISQIQVL